MCSDLSAVKKTSCCIEGDLEREIKTRNSLGKCLKAVINQVCNQVIFS